MSANRKKKNRGLSHILGPLKPRRGPEAPDLTLSDQSRDDPSVIKWVLSSMEGPLALDGPLIGLGGENLKPRTGPLRHGMDHLNLIMVI